MTMVDPAMMGPPELTGRVLGGRYEVLGKLGVGGMASVYEGRRVGLHNRVAIKVLKPELCEDPGNVKRFLREARAASCIEHENIVAIVDFGETEAMPVYFVMEFLEGHDIKQLIQAEGTVGWSRCVAILLQAVSALGAAHAKGIVHRDVKPANIFVVRRPNGDDWVKVLDFGIAKVVEEGLGGITRGVTMTNGLLGTVAFMAPEQARGGTIDARTDVYALGVVMYQMVTGRVPFRGSNPFMVLEAHVNEAPQPPRELNPEVPPEAEAVILRCLAKRPEYRYQSMAELHAELEAMATQKLPHHDAGKHITHTERQQYAIPASIPSAGANTSFPSAAMTAAPLAAPEDGGGPTAPYGRASAVPAKPRATAMPQSTVVNATMPGTPPSSSVSGPAATGSTQLLSHVKMAPTPKKKSPRVAFFGVGVGVGIAAACALTFMVMRSTQPEPTAAAVPQPRQVPASVGSAEPKPSGDLKPFPERPSQAAAGPSPELRPPSEPAADPKPVEAKPDPEPTPAVAVGTPERPARKRGRGRGKGRKSGNTVEPAATPPPAEPAEEKPSSDLHPDLKNVYE